MTSPTVPTVWLTPTEAAQHVRAKSTDLLRAAVKNGDLPAFGYGREMRFKAADLDAWMEAHPFEPGRRSA